jgi:hypothetical protein
MRDDDDDDDGKQWQRRGVDSHCGLAETIQKIS